MIAVPEWHASGQRAANRLKRRRRKRFLSGAEFAGGARARRFARRRPGKRAIRGGSAENRGPRVEIAANRSTIHETKEQLVQYMLMVYLDEQRFAALPEAEQIRIHRDCTNWHRELLQSGHALAAVGLHPPATATTVRERAGRAIITDGPCAETKEVLGGYELVECKDLDEAIAIARRFPALRAGLALEVRPIMSEDEQRRLCPTE